MDYTKKLIVITGCDSGIGKALAEIFIKNNYFVLISFLNVNHFNNNDKAFSKKLNITNENEIIQFVEYYKKLENDGFEIEMLINNVGVALCGPIENIPLDILRLSFEINYFGLFSLTQKMIPFLIKSKGKIINIGSLAGRIAPPFSAPYSSSKFALEGFTDTLRREMNPYKIKTIIFEPAAIATPIWNKIRDENYSFVDKKYEKTKNLFLKNFVEGGNNGLSPEIAANKIFKILIKKNNKTRYIISKNLFVEYLKILIPHRIMDFIIRKLFKMDY